MNWYYNAKPTIETDAGIKAKSKRGDFVKNWWATRWIEQMEQVMDRGRLQRGRRYARKGQVLALTEEEGAITADVQGSRSRPYEIVIEIESLRDEEWAQVIGVLTSRPIFIAQLLAGDMPQDIEEAFDAVDLSLFPASADDLAQSCNCPDYAAVCKHLAAVHYILAERFDEDPFLLFRVRGRTKDEILSHLSTHQTEEAEEPEPAPPLTVDGFWEAGDELDQMQFKVEPPLTPYPVLVRLGSPDFMPDLDERLATVYDTISQNAIDAAFKEE